MKALRKNAALAVLLIFVSVLFLGCAETAEEAPSVREPKPSETVEEVSEEVQIEEVSASEPVIEIIPAPFDGELPVQLSVTDIDNVMFLESIFGSEKNDLDLTGDENIILPEYRIVQTDSAENTMGGEIKEVYTYVVQDENGSGVDLDLFVYPIYDEESQKIVREYCTYCEITEDGAVTDKGFFPIIIEENILKTANAETLDFPELSVDEHGALILPNAVQNQDGEEVDEALLNALKEHNANNPDLYEDTDENKIPADPYCDGAGNLTPVPVYPINEDEIILLLLQADVSQLEEYKANGFVDIGESVEQPVLNDNYNSPSSEIIEAEPPVVSVVITAELNEDGELVFAGGTVSEEPEAESTAKPEQSTKPAQVAAPESANVAADNAPQTPAQPQAPAQPEVQTPAETVQEVPSAPSGHYEQVWVVDEPARTVEEPVYETRVVNVCNKCGFACPGSTDEIGNHMIEHFINEGVTYRYHTESQKIQVGTNTVEIPEKGHYEQVWVED